MDLADVIQKSVLEGETGVGYLLCNAVEHVLKTVQLAEHGMFEIFVIVPIAA